MGVLYLTLSILGKRMGIIALVVGLQVLAVYAPFLSVSLLQLQALGMTEWLIVVSAGVAALTGTEFEKWWRRGHS